MLWAALRQGFGEGTWAEAFCSESCLAAILPRNDFLVYRPTTDLKVNFAPRWLGRCQPVLAFHPCSYRDEGCGRN